MSEVFDILAFDDFGAGFAVFYLIYLVIMCGFSVALYVLRSLGMYTIAKRRQINHPWMAWVPVVDLYLLGCISDQYQYVTKGKNKAKRRALLTLSIIMAVVYVATMVLLIWMVVEAVVSAAAGATGTELTSQVLGLLFGLMGLYLVLAGVSIALVVVRYMAMYDLYSSCDPGTKVLFLLLSIFFSVAEPFFIFFSRHKDLGMPPRRPAQPVYIEPEPQQY